MRKAAALVIVLFLSGCGGDTPTRSDQSSDGVTLSLSVSPEMEGSHVLTVTVEAVNHGPGPVGGFEGCGFWMHGMELEFLDRDSKVWYPDNRVWWTCPDRVVEFEPGQHLVATAEFDGFSYGSGGARVQALSGVFTAVARFTWIGGPDPYLDVHEIQHRVSFAWNAG